MTLQIDPRWLVHSVEVAKKLDEDNWNKPIYADPITYNRVRVDMTKEFTGTGNDRTITANATVFLFAKFTGNFPVDIDDTWLDAKLTFNGHDYLVKNWSPYSEPTSANLWSIELKVI
ncbi:putative minor capsid protein [Lapidilactobacillus mulanensis]|uniref:Minor capsid protein n=1 Tax=Lapidilactobacillus mulanensis TaxID=2485999 RepID=A0ABW4DSM5_9LACO|nr:putative minor capsid protein [Lapidilactobacillus mulanensis]